MKNNTSGVSEQDIISMLDSLAENGASRMSIKVAEGAAAGDSGSIETVKSYHHGRCDVGSPFATGKLYDFEDGCIYPD